MAITGLKSDSSALSLQTPAQVADAFERTRNADAAAQFEQKPAMDALASHVLAAFDANKRFRAEEFDEQILQDLRQLNRKYDPDKEADLKRAQMPVIFYPLTSEKVAAGLAWINDVLNFDNGKPFSLTPTPLPSLQDEDEERIANQSLIDLQAFLATGQDATEAMVFEYAAKLRDKIDAELMEEAKDRAKRMETLCYDQMVEGGWHEVFPTFLFNLAWAPVSYLKGPIMRRVAVKKFIRGPNGWQKVIRRSIKPTFEAPSPFDMYPARYAVTPNDGDLIERVRYAPLKLSGMKGAPGWQDAAIDKIMATYELGTYQTTESIDAERAQLEGNGSDTGDRRGTIEGLEYWGSVKGQLLKDKGVTKDVNGDPLQDLTMYEANVIVVDKLVVFASVNPDPTGKRPYVKTSWEKKAGSFFGNGVPRIIREVQQLCNAAIRDLCFNMSQSSGYQTVINDMSRVPQGERVTESFPGKIWQFLKPNPMDASKPMDLWQPATRAPELMAVWEKFATRADITTGIPSYEIGQPSTSAAGRTSSGLMALMSNAARGIKMVLSNIDKDIYRPVVEALRDFNMEFSDDESIKGDSLVQVSGALSQIVNEQNTQRIMQLLQTTANPLDAQVVGPEERAVMLREVAKITGLPKDSVVKSDDEIKAAKETQQAEEQQALIAQGQQTQGVG
jgi:hypothetical protein